jgi:hypothetical protein
MLKETTVGQPLVFIPILATNRVKPLISGWGGITIQARKDVDSMVGKY